MCGSMADIQSASAEIRRGKKEDRKKKKQQGKNIMACPIPWDGHKKELDQVTTSLESVSTITSSQKSVSDKAATEDRTLLSAYNVFKNVEAWSRDPKDPGYCE